MATVILEHVKPTEPAILEMVRAHYSHLDNVRQRPRTEKTSKTWWSNARLVVFSDPERTLVFAWQWPKDGIRKDGQNGYNNTLFHRSERCPYQASDIVLAAEKAVVEHWGDNRAYTYVDPVKIKSTNPGYCYKIAGWRQIKISKTGKPLLEKILGNGNHRKDESKPMASNFNLVLRTYTAMRQMTPDDLALLNTLRALNDVDRQKLIETMSDKPQKKAGKKSAGGGGGRSSRGQSIKNQLSNRRQGQQGVSIDDNEDDGRCTYKIGEDAGGPIICDTTIDNNVHHKQTDPDYHEFTMGKSDAQSAAGGS